jgi:hypothetical protein
MTTPEHDENRAKSTAAAAHAVHFGHGPESHRQYYRRTIEFIQATLIF